MHPAIFIDRDGVVIENRPNYVRSVDDIEFFPEALAAIARVSLSPYKLVIITNQAGIGRGIIPVHVAEQINQRVIAEIEKTGGRIDALFLCPHKPSDGCNCRKPKPGLILQAAQELEIELDKSIMIGDSLSDVQAGLSAGVQRVALVRTGRGAEQEYALEAQNLPSFPVYNNLSEALDDLIHYSRSTS
jgi:histidinol-phosphate phosphatase family protein